MDEVILQNIRCFHTKQITPLAPLTFLVGENSTGKSTFLASIKIACEIALLEHVPDFNEEPFLMGAFDQIANVRGGRGGCAPSFNIGLNVLLNDELTTQTTTSKAEIICTFVGGSSQPKISKWELNCSNYKVEIVFGETLDDFNMLLNMPSGDMTFNKPIKFFISGRSPLILLEQLEYLKYIITNTKRMDQYGVSYTSKPTQEDLATIGNIIKHIRSKLPDCPFSFAPIRTKPKRTYDIMKDTPSSAGDHIPVVLSKTFADKDRHSLKTRDLINSFGNLTGLYEDIDIKRLGKKESDPFQLKVKISGPAFNLVDVGYGVSQVLPIIVDSLMEAPGRHFLLQQPEVHLHPKAQAGLGTFLLALANTHNKHFIVETHSDYMLNRVRMEIRDGKKLKPDMVSILFFERINNEVFIRPLSIDKQGNILNAPQSYRKFFLEEDRKFLGI